MAEPITEEQGVHKAWYDEAQAMTPDKIPEFIRKLTQDYDHDYGTVCHACAAAAVAAAQSINHSDQGGITGFQAGCIMWSFIEHWMHMKSPARLQNFEELLFPQYADKFSAIPLKTWEWLQTEAKKKIAESEDMAHPAVLAHWHSIVDGAVPFDLRIEATN